MPLSSQPDPILTIDGFPLQYFEIPEFIKHGGPFRAIVHKQPGGARQIDSMGPDPHPISFSGIMLTADGQDRMATLYAKYEAGNQVDVVWAGWERQCIITHFQVNYRANNYVEYSIELTEVQGAELPPGGVNINDLGGPNFLGGANGVGAAAPVIGGAGP